MFLSMVESAKQCALIERFRPVQVKLTAGCPYHVKNTWARSIVYLNELVSVLYSSASSNSDSNSDSDTRPQINNDHNYDGDSSGFSSTTNDDTTEGDSDEL